MKPNFKQRGQLVKTTFDGQSKPGQKKAEEKMENNSEQFEPLGESLMGERQFLYFDNNKSSLNNNSSLQNQIEQNISLVGTMQKVYFSNASTINKQEIQKDKRLHEQINAFKPVQKLTRQQPQNFKKAKSLAQNDNNKQHAQQEDDNEFLALDNIGKWQKSNKSTVISEEMKKMHSHLENRLTETKWVKKKPSHHQQTSKTEKNSSIVQNQSTQMNSSINANSMKVVNTVQKTDTSKDSVTQHTIHVKKGAQKYMQGMSELAKEKVSSMTSWKEEQKKEEDQEVEDQAQDGEQQEQQEQSSQEEEEQQEESEEEQQEDQQEEQEGDQQQDEDKSSGEEGWDQPEQEQPEQQQPEQEKEDPFTVPEQQKVQQVKAKKWGSKIDTNSKVPQPTNNPSIRIEAKQEHPINQPQAEGDQIQDLTQGQIPNEQVDPNWQKLQQILLRIQKLVN